MPYDPTEVLPFGAIGKIRELRLNRRLTCKSRGKHKRLNQARLGVNHDNLIQVEVHQPDNSTHETQLNVATLNIRSIKTNEQLVLRELNHFNIDLCLVMETWLKDSDDIWLKGSDLNNGMYRCFNANRSYSSGGGIILICKSSLDVKSLDQANNHTYEHASWQINHKKNSLTVTGIYHPPPKDRITNSMFIDEITEHLTTLLMGKQDNIILGDFNLHIDDPHDVDTSIFLDTITTMGLTQHVTMPMHYKGNTLDLLLSETQSNLIGKVQHGALVSDHYMVYAPLSIKKQGHPRDKVTIRKISVITDSMLCQEFNDEKLTRRGGP